MNDRRYPGWTKAPYYVATDGLFTQIASGWQRYGVAFRRFSPARSKEIQPRWSFSHINTGHHIVTVRLPPDRILQFANDLVDLADWTFEKLDGWKSRDPGLPAKVAILLNGKDYSIGSGDCDIYAAQEVSRLMEALAQR